jgi:hypothetical protein
MFSQGLFDLVMASEKATFHAPFTGIALSPEGLYMRKFPFFINLKILD